MPALVRLADAWPIAAEGMRHACRSIAHACHVATSCAQLDFLAAAEHHVASEREAGIATALLRLDAATRRGC